MIGLQITNQSVSENLFTNTYTIFYKKYIYIYKNSSNITKIHLKQI